MGIQRLFYGVLEFNYGKMEEFRLSCAKKRKKNRHQNKMLSRLQQIESVGGKMGLFFEARTKPNY